MLDFTRTWCESFCLFFLASKVATNCYFVLHTKNRKLLEFTQNFQCKSEPQYHSDIHSFQDGFRIGLKSFIEFINGYAPFTKKALQLLYFYVNST